MCLGLPGKVVSLRGNRAKIRLQDHTHWIDISALGQKVAVGDYLISYQKTAINKVPKNQAEEIISLIG